MSLIGSALRRSAQRSQNLLMAAQNAAAPVATAASLFHLAPILTNERSIRSASAVNGISSVMLADNHHSAPDAKASMTDNQLSQGMELHIRWHAVFRLFGLLHPCASCGGSW